MAKRVIGAERLFSLGDYKNVRLIETVEFDDEGYDDEALDAVRYITFLNLYLGFAMHQKVLKEVKEVGFVPEEIMEWARSERQIVKEELNNLMEETQNGSDDDASTG